jgi:hypothetical protein
MRAAACWLAVVALAGCGDDFEPRSHLEAYRVVGIQAEPPELPSDGKVTLHVYDFDPASVAPADAGPPPGAPYYIWVVCAYSLGSAVQYDCLDPRLEFAIRTDGPELALDLAHPPDGYPPLKAVYAGLRAELERREAEGEDVSALEDQIDPQKGTTLTVKLYAGREGAGHVDAVKRVTIHDPAPGNTPAPPNHNPTIAAFRLGGETDVVSVPTGEKLALSVEMAPGSVETYVDSSTGESTDEELLYSWFTSGGTLEPDITFGSDTKVELTAPDTPQRLRLFVAVRDGRGGLAVSEKTLDVLAPP